MEIRRGKGSGKRVPPGGDWCGNAGFLQSSFRYYDTPGYWFNNVGFRPVKTE